MIKLSVIIPSYKDPYLIKTIDSLLETSKLGDQLEIIAVLDGYWPTFELRNDPRVRYVHLGKNVGMREAINTGVKVARGEFLMRTDEHCKFADGFDKAMVDACEPNWIMTAPRYFLDPKKWEVMQELKPYIYEKLVIHNNYKFEGQKWHSRERERRGVQIDETMAMQGSCWVMPHAWWDKVIGELQTEGYGPLIQDSTEMIFKTWKAGGKMMVNKNTWYAHKHVSFTRTHQNGTPENPANNEQGYQYAIKTWREYYENEIAPKWFNIPPPGDWYQEAIIGGMAMPTIRSQDTNQKRWENLIEPFIEKDGAGRKFIDLGCNAGFYSRKAAMLGYDATGVEISYNDVSKARYWESREPLGVKFVHDDLMNYDMPSAHTVLLANVHYWLTEEQMKILVNRLLGRALNVIVVGRNGEAKEHKSPSDIESLKKSFDGWTIAGELHNSFQNKHYSVKFVNPNLVELLVDELFQKQWVAESKYFTPRFIHYLKLIDSGKEYDPHSTKYRRYLTWRKFKNELGIMEKQKAIYLDAKKSGIKEPPIVGRNIDGEFNGDRLSDGDHRLIIARHLGHKYIICKKLNTCSQS